MYKEKVAKEQRWKGISRTIPLPENEVSKADDRREYLYRKCLRGSTI